MAFHKSVIPIVPVIRLEQGESENKILSSILILCIYLLDNHLTQITQAKGKSHISGGKAVRKAIFKQNQYELPMNIIWKKYITEG